MKIEGLHKLEAKLKEMATAYGPTKVGVQVGYTQTYAIHVHEKQASHKVGQAKYLEQPAREYQGTIAAIIAKAIKKGKTLEQAMLLGGLRLQRESQKLVPVDTSALKASAFTALDREAERKATEAYQRSEAIRFKAGMRRQVKRERARA